MTSARRSGPSRRAGVALAAPGLLLAVCWLAPFAVLGQAAEQREEVVRGEAPIVAGNAVSAKKRALAEAFRQAVERAFAEIVAQGEPLPQPWPPGVTQLKASFASAAQKFVRSYRVIDQSGDGGVFKVTVEADVDTVLLRGAIDRARGGAPAAVPIAAPKGPSVLLVAGPPGGGATAFLVQAVTAQGVSAQAADRTEAEAQLVASAAKQNANALFVVESAQEEGAVRGTLQVSVKCSLAVHLFLARGPAGRPVLDQTTHDRGFGANVAAAREDCVARAATLVARAVVSRVRAPDTGGNFVTLQLDIADPGAVALILRACKRMGSVTGAEVRQVMASSAEVRVFTRMGGPALQQALVREIGSKLAIVPIQTGNDSLALRVRHPDSSDLEENR